MKTFPILSYSEVLGAEKCYIFLSSNKIKITNQDSLKSKSKYNFLFWDCQRESNFPKLFKIFFEFQLDWREVKNWHEGMSWMK